MPQRFRSVWKSFRNGISRWRHCVKEKITSVLQGLRSKVASLWNRIRPTVGKAWSTTREWVGNAWSAIRKWIGTAWKTIKHSGFGKWVSRSLLKIRHSGAAKGEQPCRQRLRCLDQSADRTQLGRTHLYERVVQRFRSDRPVDLMADHHARFG